MNGALAWPSKAGRAQKEALLAQVKTSVEGELQLYTSITMNSNKYWSFSISLCSSGYQNILGSFYTTIIAIIIVVAFLLWDGERKIPPLKRTCYNSILQP